MNISPSTQWSFRPAQMPEDMFIKTFVGRESELQQIFSHINFNLIPSAAPGNRKNLLYKSERGIGKTSLFLAVKYKLKAQWSGMLKKIIPVFFNEQEDFNTAEKLILRIFEIILDEGDFVVPESLSYPNQWRKAYLQVKSNIARCLDILKENLGREEKKLVLFIENFDSLAYRILRKKGSKKTGKLSSQEIFTRLVKDPDILLVCSAIEEPETSYDYGEESFKTLELKPVGDFYELVLQRARFDNNLFLLSNKEKLKNKIKAFEYLTGGNTRLMVHLYECMVEKDIGKLEFMLNDMINKSTPLFEWTIEKFVDYESREILNALARRGGNATIKEIAEDTFNSENSVRTLLNKLRKRRFVQKINEKRDKSDIYIMIPMMFFIWYQKSVLQRKDIILDFFIHFVDLFFDPTELADRKRIDHLPQLRDEKAEAFASYFSYVKKYIEAGKFPLKSYEEKRGEEPLETDAESEKMIYEVVRARQDDTILQTRIHKALTLKAESNLSEAANLSRIIARGYLILAEETDQSFYDQAEENIRRAIEIYQSLKTEPLETVRCLLMLVEILSDTERKEELKLFAQTIIRIGEKGNSPKFNAYLGHAYKYLGFAETEAEKKLELFNQSLDYFQKDEKEEEQVILLLLNIGLIYQARKKHEIALEYLEKALELSKEPEYSSQLDVIIISIALVYIDAEDYRGGKKRIDEITNWLETEKYEGIKFQGIYNYIALIFAKSAEFPDAEKYLLKSIEFAEKENDYNWIIVSSMSLIRIYLILNKEEKIKERLKEIGKVIENIIDESDEYTNALLDDIAKEFFEFGYIDEAISILEKMYQKYKLFKNLPDQANTLLNIGNFYTKKGDFTRAEENFQEAVEIARANNLKETLVKAENNYASLLIQQNKINKAINILERIDREEIHEKELNRVIKDNLLLSYIEKCRELYIRDDVDNALVYLRKGLKSIEYLSVEDFVRRFYFGFVLPLIRQFGKRTYPFFKEVDLYLSTYYDNKEKGEYIKIFKSVVELLKGKDFNKLTKDMEPSQRGLLALINARLDEDTILAKIEELIENKKMDNAEAELYKKLLKANGSKSKSKLTFLLSFIKDSPIASISPINDLYLKDLNVLFKNIFKVNSYEFEFVNYIEQLISNETPISTFIKKYGDSVDPKLVEEINKDIRTAASFIFQRIIDENITEIDKVVTICGSRLNFESLLYIIKKEFPVLTAENQDLIILLLKQIIDKLPQSYKCLVLDFCARHFVNLNPTQQAALVDSCLKLLEEKKAALYFLREVRGFLDTAKNTLDEPLKTKIGKELINIDLKDEDPK